MTVIIKANMSACCGNRVYNYVDGVNIKTVVYDAQNNDFPVPPGSTYSVTANNASLVAWYEVY